jgi:hypothetical protein
MMRNDDFNALEGLRLAPPPGTKPVRRWRGAAKVATASEAEAERLADEIKRVGSTSSAWEIDVQFSDNIVLAARAEFTARSANAGLVEEMINRCAERVGVSLLDRVAIVTLSSVKLSHAGPPRQSRGAGTPAGSETGAKGDHG